MAVRPGSVSYLESAQSAAVICWLPSKNRNLAELQGYIFENYDVVFDSKQSYYTLFNQARIRGKKLKNATLKKTQQCSKKTGDYRLVGDSSISDYFWPISGIFTP